MSTLLIALTMCSLNAGPTETQPPVSMMDAYTNSRRIGESWDLEIELGLRLLPEILDELKWDRGLLKHDPDHIFWFRVRAGYMILHEPMYLSLGPTLSYGGLGEWAVGFQTVFTSIWGGFWFGIEPAWSFDRGIKISTSAGFGIVGLEWATTVKPAGHAILFKIRIPIGLIWFVKTNF